ncbi:hypothetical protein PYCCODRAFT_1432858 [Trametes coccinea BRFM310]|uniref:DUF6533 domain-containing protein n=1 Tax=Trametes coccinea (strain BRFM310) TaxID=1353009 RepID=A0A1Y2IVI1_TRAC3|nr:hypothetical protein PYCCODRAFT_1432858 [Trametes coccinea BRFM310]
MSSDDESEVAQEILDSYSRLVVENYFIIASSALLFVDWFMTFTDEVQRIWKGRFTGATVVFLITRYVAIAERIVLTISVFLPTLSNESCVPVLRLDDSLTDISYLMFGVFVMLRTRGIWGRGWLPLAFLALLTPVRTIIYIFTQTHYTPIAFGVPLYGCGADYGLPSNTLRDLELIARISATVLDSTVIVLTWIRTLGVKRESHRLGMRTPIVTLLLRDGTIYFLVILFIQIFAIVSTNIGSTFILWDVWPLFEQAFTVIFSCRFMLNLRGVYLADPTRNPGHTDEFGITVTTRDESSIGFASIIGNFGAPVNTFGVSTDSYAGSTATGMTDEMEDETVDMSTDPLSYGLWDYRSDTMELPETFTAARE